MYAAHFAQPTDLCYSIRIEAEANLLERQSADGRISHANRLIGVPGTARNVRS